MRIVSGIVRQPLRIDEDSELSGMCSADVTVAPGRRLLLSGMVRGDVVLEGGASVDVTGLLGGAIRRR